MSMYLLIGLCIDGLLAQCQSGTRGIITSILIVSLWPGYLTYLFLYHIIGIGRGEDLYD